MVTTTYRSGDIAAGANDSIVFTLPAFSRTAGSGPSIVDAISVLNSPLYRAYSSLYEEVLLRGVSYEITVNNPIGATAATLPPFMIFTSVDRRYAYGEVPPSQSQLTNYSSSKPISYVTYNVTKFRKYVGARDLVEKTQYHDCTVAYYNQGGNQYWYDPAVNSAAENPNFFNPALFFFVRFPFAPTATMQLQLSIRCTFYLTFRNPAPFDSVPTVPAAAAAAASGPYESFSTLSADEQLLDIPDPHPLSGSTDPPLIET